MEDKNKKEDINMENDTQKKSRYKVYTMDDIKKNIYSDDYSRDEDEDEDNKKPFFEDSKDGTRKAVKCLILQITKFLSLIGWLICSLNLNNPHLLCLYGLLGYYYWIINIPLNNLSGIPKKGIKKFLNFDLFIFILTVIFIIIKII